MEVRYTNSAKRSLRRIPANKAKSVIEGMKDVAQNPFATDNNRAPLQGVENGFRKRFGDLRVLYTVDTKVRILEVFKIGNRGEIYK